MISLKFNQLSLIPEILEATQVQANPDAVKGILENGFNKVENSPNLNQSLFL